MPFLKPTIVFHQFPSIMIDGYGDLMTHFTNGINCWIGFHGSSPINSNGVTMAGTYKPSRGWASVIMLAHHLPEVEGLSPMGKRLSRLPTLPAKSRPSVKPATLPLKPQSN